MTIKEQIQHAFKYQYPIQFQTKYTGCGEGLVTKVQDASCEITGKDNWWLEDGDILRCVPVPPKPPEKLTLFYVAGYYFDKKARSYVRYANTGDGKQCPVCGNDKCPIRYRRAVGQFCCEDCVTVIDWTNLMESYEKGQLND